MAFQSKDLSVLAYANGFTLWHYTTNDATADVDTNSYFDAAAHMLRTGDMVLANVNAGATPTSGIYLINANVGGAVDAADMTRVGAADTD